MTLEQPGLGSDPPNVSGLERGATMIIPQSNPRPPSPVYEGTHETPVSLDSDQDPYSNATVSSPRKRPPRRKAAKETRQKSKASPIDTSNSISVTIRELSGQSEQRKNFYDEQKL